MAKTKATEEVLELGGKAQTQKEMFLELYATLKTYGINSISDLENLIARSE